MFHLFCFVFLLMSNYVVKYQTTSVIKVSSETWIADSVLFWAPLDTIQNAGLFFFFFFKQNLSWNKETKVKKGKRKTG